MKVMINICGPSGSGKSTLAASLVEAARDATAYAADDYFLNQDGIYQFDPRKLGQAHLWCQLMVEQACVNDTEVVLVHNTGTKLQDRNPYKAIAVKHGYQYFEVVVDGDYQNQHQVSERALEAQREHFQFRGHLR